MKSKNLYDYLENLDVYSENVLTYCEDLQTLHMDSLEYLEDFKEKGKKQLETSFAFFGVNNKADLAKKKKTDAEVVHKKIANITKFIEFMKKEDKAYNDVITSDEYTEWVDSDSLESFFVPIKSLPVYINKHAGVKVVDLLGSFKEIMDSIVVEIEELTGVPFPVDSDKPQIMAVQHEMDRKGLSLDSEEKVQELGHLILTYEDFECLISLIKSEIEQLMEPVRI